MTTTTRETVTIRNFNKDYTATLLRPSLPLAPTPGAPKLAYVPSHSTDIRVRFAAMKAAAPRNYTEWEERL